MDDFLSNALLAIALGLIALAVLLPLIGIVLFSLLDILSRKDIGWRKLFWLGVVLAVPVAGLAVYWVFRPKDFDPWVESGEPAPMYTQYLTPAPGATAPVAIGAGSQRAPVLVLEPSSLQHYPELQGADDDERRAA